MPPLREGPSLPYSWGPSRAPTPRLSPFCSLQNNPSASSSLFGALAPTPPLPTLLCALRFGPPPGSPPHGLCISALTHSVQRPLLVHPAHTSGLRRRLPLHTPACLPLPPCGLTGCFPGLPTSSLSFPGTCCLPAPWSSWLLTSLSFITPCCPLAACLSHQDSVDSDCSPPV